MGSHDLLQFYLCFNYNIVRNFSWKQVKVTICPLGCMQPTTIHQTTTWTFGSFCHMWSAHNNCHDWDINLTYLNCLSGITRPLPESPLQMSPDREDAQMWIFPSSSICAPEQEVVRMSSNVSKHSFTEENLDGRLLLKTSWSYDYDKVEGERRLGGEEGRGGEGELGVGGDRVN